jgi:hypothetical protein
MCIKDLLTYFSALTRLHVNYHKTTPVPINIDPPHDQFLAAAFGCRVEGLPFTLDCLWEILGLL